MTGPCEIWGSQGCWDMKVCHVGEWFPVFQMSVVPTSWRAQEPEFSDFHPHSLKHFNITCITSYLPGRSRSAIWAALASSILIPSLAPGARSATVPDTLLAAESICADIMFTCTHNTSVLMYDLQDVYTLLERQQNYSNESVCDVLHLNIYTGVFNRHISYVWKANTMPFTWYSTVPLFMITKDQHKPSESPNPFSVHLKTDQITKITYRGNMCFSKQSNVHTEDVWCTYQISFNNR